MGTTDGWQMLSFLETPHEALDGLVPRIALEQGVSGQRIVDLAKAEGQNSSKYSRSVTFRFFALIFNQKLPFGVFVWHDHGV